MASTMPDDGDADPDDGDREPDDVRDERRVPARRQQPFAATSEPRHAAGRVDRKASRREGLAGAPRAHRDARRRPRCRRRAAACARARSRRCRPGASTAPSSTEWRRCRSATSAPVGRAARLDLELVHLDVALEERRHRGGATADVAEHGVGRCGTRAERCIDPELAHERQQRQPVQHRDRERLALGGGVRARQHVRCVVAGRGDHQVHPGNRLLEQQFGVGDVALHDRDAWQPLAEAPWRAPDRSRPGPPWLLRSAAARQPGFRRRPRRAPSPVGPDGSRRRGAPGSRGARRGW